MNCVDHFGLDASELKKKRLFLFDMDGTIYVENHLFDGTLQLLKFISRIGGRYVFITNNSSKSVSDYIVKIQNMGIKAGLDNFYTSAQATIAFIKKKYAAKKVYCMGTRSLVKEFQDAGFMVSVDVDEQAEVIVVGFDTELTSVKLMNTCKMLRLDIPYIATNPDLACPVSFGFIPDCGSICQMIFNATGRKPHFIGKPSRNMVDFIMAKFSCSQEETVVVGDRLYTDIAAGINAGVTSICVLTGETKEADLKNTPYKPTYTFNTIRNLWECIN